MQSNVIIASMKASAMPPGCASYMMYHRPDGVCGFIWPCCC